MTRKTKSTSVVLRGDVEIAKSQKDIDAFYAAKKREGLKIDPATAEVEYIMADVLDPYGIHPVCHPDSCWGRLMFARNAGGSWINGDDLPRKTSRALRSRKE